MDNIINVALKKEISNLAAAAKVFDPNTCIGGVGFYCFNEESKTIEVYGDIEQCARLVNVQLLTEVFPYKDKKIKNTYFIYDGLKFECPDFEHPIESEVSE